MKIKIGKRIKSKSGRVGGVLENSQIGFGGWRSLDAPYA
jgi:hypothetical protein